MANVTVTTLNEHRVPGRPLGRHVEHDVRSLAYTAEPDRGRYRAGPVLWRRWSPAWGKAGSFRFTAATWAQLRDQQADVTVPHTPTRPAPTQTTIGVGL